MPVMGMWVFESKSWKVILVLVAIVCVGLLSAFKLGAFTSKPIVIAKTTVLKPVSWEFVRPFRALDLVGHDFYNGSSFVTDSGGVISETIDFLSYWPQTDYSDIELDMNFTLSSSFKQGFMVDANVTFQENDSATSTVVFYSNLQACENLSITNQEESLVLGEGESLTAATLANSNDSRQTYFREPLEWYPSYLENQTQAITMSFDVTYSNGTVYEEVIQPFKLQLDAYVNNTSFSTAEPIQYGTYTLFYTDDVSGTSYYNVSVPSMKSINVSATADINDGLHINVDLYNQIGSLVNETGTIDYGTVGSVYAENWGNKAENYTIGFHCPNAGTFYDFNVSIGNLRGG